MTKIISTLDCDVYDAITINAREYVSIPVSQASALQTAESHFRQCQQVVYAIRRHAHGAFEAGRAVQEGLDAAQVAATGDEWAQAGEDAWMDVVCPQVAQIVTRAVAALELASKGWSRIIADNARWEA